MVETASVVREALKADFVGTEYHAGRKRKRVVSAGALHPVRCVIIGEGDGAIAYDDEADVFFQVGTRNSGQLETLRGKCATILPDASGHILGLMADIGAVSQVYSTPESLVWRDAGAVLQTLALVSEAFGLGFCPLGILGQELADALLPPGHRYLGVGVAAIGRRTAD